MKEQNQANIKETHFDKCPTCGNNPATEPHPCPFAQEIGRDHDEEYCTCCDACQYKCAMEV